MKIVIAIYVLFLIIYIYTFMYQRTTLQIMRELNSNVELQIILTPTWMGSLSWVGNIGIVAAHLLLWLKVGLVWAIGGFLFSFLLITIYPIPFTYFVHIVKKHLKSEIEQLTDTTRREEYQKLFCSIENMKIK